MKAVYRSIKPYWLYLILIGKKTVEIGKTFPKSNDWNKEVFLHCSKDMESFKRIPEKDREWMRKYLGKVACRFVCDSFSSFKAMGEVQAIYNKFKNTRVSDDEIIEYANGKRLYYWHISDLVIYDKPRELSEFYTLKKCNACNGGYESTACIYDENCKVPVPLKRPPQSWAYVESEVKE